eukprot:3581659-Rhodomonas_salina.1
MDFIQRNNQKGLGRSGVEQANSILSVWAVRNVPKCCFCNQLMCFSGFEVNWRGRLRICWQCLPCTWKLDCIIESRVQCPDADEQPTISDTNVLDISVLVPRDETRFAFAGPAVNSCKLAHSHLQHSPDVPAVDSPLGDPFHVSVSNAQTILHALDEATPPTVESAREGGGVIGEQPYFPSLFPDDDDDELPHLSQGQAVAVEEDPALFAGEPDPESTQPGFHSVLPWSEYIAGVVEKLEPRFDSVAEDTDVVNLSAEMEVLCTQIQPEPTHPDDTDYNVDEDGSTIF